MAFDDGKKEINELLGSISDEKIRIKITNAMECVDDPPRHPIVTDAIKQARKNGYKEIALELAKIAYNKNPDNPSLVIG